MADVEPQKDWRQSALKWLQGEGLNKQGRARSDKMPSRQKDRPRFKTFKEGATMVVEADGDGVHLASPADADQRTRLFKVEGAHIERVKASESDSHEKAGACAKRLLADFDRRLATR